MALAGTTWTINSDVDMFSSARSTLDWIYSFISNNTTYSYTNFESGKVYNYVYYGSTKVWGSDTGWINEAYRTIEILNFDSARENDIETWLNANAVQVITTVDYLTTNVEITSIANAIRTKGGTSAQLVYPAGFVSAIGAITTPYPSADGVSFGTVPSTISFRISTVTYQADNGMTWTQWVNSDYNPDFSSGLKEFSIDSNNNVQGFSSLRYISYNNSYVSASDSIVADRMYTLER